MVLCSTVESRVVGTDGATIVTLGAHDRMVARNLRTMPVAEDPASIT
jgi:hypothetical protein